MRKPHATAQYAGWWLKNPAYRRYMLREATALPLFLYCLVLISGLYRLTQGEAAFAAWLESMRSPGFIVFHLLALSAVLFHAWTWIELVPKILVIRTARVSVSGELIKRAHQLGALACFAALLGLALYLFNTPGSASG